MNGLIILLTDPVYFSIYLEETEIFNSISSFRIAFYRKKYIKFSYIKTFFYKKTIWSYNFSAIFFWEKKMFQIFESDMDFTGDLN